MSPKTHGLGFFLTLSKSTSLVLFAHKYLHPYIFFLLSTLPIFTLNFKIFILTHYQEESKVAIKSKVSSNKVVHSAITIEKNGIWLKKS